MSRRHKGWQGGAGSIPTLHSPVLGGPKFLNKLMLEPHPSLHPYQAKPTSSNDKMEREGSSGFFQMPCRGAASC